MYCTVKKFKRVAFMLCFFFITKKWMEWWGGVMKELNRYSLTPSENHRAQRHCGKSGLVIYTAFRQQKLPLLFPVSLNQISNAFHHGLGPIQCPSHLQSTLLYLASHWLRRLVSALSFLSMMSGMNWGYLFTHLAQSAFIPHCIS